MKKLGKLKLNQLRKAELELREMNSLRGGACAGGYGCGCACYPGNLGWHYSATNQTVYFV